MHEFDLINNYFFKIAKKNKFALNLNDDVFFDKKRGVVISIDTYNIGTHFYDFKSPDLVIKKILRSSISDLICKGVTPKFYFISGSGNKKTFTKNNLYKISKSLKSEQNKFKIDLCGGDTTFSNKLSFFENIVSPPHSAMLNIFCSDLSDFEIFTKFFFVNVFLFPDPEIK